MARKFDKTPLDENSIRDFVQRSDDFGFEMQVVKFLRSVSSDVKHGETYSDPFTGIARQFDIRATVQVEECSRVKMSVECKNLKEFFPLVISQTVRKEHESNHSIMLVGEKCAHGTELKVKGYYKEAACVGKSWSQIGKLENGELTGDNKQFYEKWSQAINSSFDLIIQSKRLPQKLPHIFTFVVPILVVPNDTLWKIDYSESGEIVGKPEKADEVSYFINKTCEYKPGYHFTLSHIEIMTLKGLKNFVVDGLRLKSRADELFGNAADDAIKKNLVL